VSLEQRIRDLAARGEITHLSLTPRAKGWAATYTPASVMGVSFAEDGDPVKAIEAALDGIKLRRKPARKGHEPHDPPATAEELSDILS
jgi:hypothetical protein